MIKLVLSKLRMDSSWVINSLHKYNHNQDLEFILTNKITHIVNTVAHIIPNHWEPLGIKYITYCWNDDESQIILDPKHNTIHFIFTLIEEVLSKGESILVHSEYGESRSTTLVVAYLMKKYYWSLIKCMEYLHSRKPEIKIRANFLH